MLKAFRKRVRLLRGDERGFTLVELLLVITIIGVLAGVGVTGYRNFQEKAYIAAADAAWRDLQVAINLYEAENGAGSFPLSNKGGDTEGAIAGQLTPAPEPLQNDLWGAPGPTGAPTLTGERLDPTTHTGDNATGFIVWEHRDPDNNEVERRTCVWVNTYPSRFNEDKCTDFTNATT